MNPGDKIGIVCCSNGWEKRKETKIRRLEEVLLGMRLIPVFSPYIFAKGSAESGSAVERAGALMDFYRDDSIKGIFDISGGDIANGVLPYLDYELIKICDKQFWGYSDLTTVINAIYTKTGKTSVLYQICNLLYDHGTLQQENFKNFVFGQGNELFRFPCEFYQGKEMEGIVV
ncbi:MAG: LD-carboxypeptidase, partial [Lachnospiraceae bacterium]|nr:LD-carboxypeptidase [Lachnospiraceae bacterium]